MDENGLNHFNIAESANYERFFMFPLKSDDSVCFHTVRGARAPAREDKGYPYDRSPLYFALLTVQPGTLSNYPSVGRMKLQTSQE